MQGQDEAGHLPAEPLAWREAMRVLGPLAPAGAPVDLVPVVEQALARVARAAGLTVLVNDPHRATASEAILRLIAERVDPAGIRILVATGTHGFSAPARGQFEGALAAGLAGPVGQIAWHDCRSGKLAAIGRSRPWRGHRWLLERPGLLAIGSTEPHYFAGFTGPHKTATIGCASYGDVEANHAGALSDRCRPGRMEGNPVHEGVAAMLAELEAVRPVAAVNLLQSGRAVLAAASGRPLEALAALAPAARQAFMHVISEPADALVLEVSGPLGISLYQADKGIKNNEWSVRDGGAMVLAAPCPAGLGQDAFVDLLRQAPGHRQAVELVARRGYRLGDHKAVRLRYLTDPACRGVKVLLVSNGISAEQAAVLGMTKARDVPHALAAAGIDPRSGRVYCVQDAGNVCVTATF